MIPVQEMPSPPRVLPHRAGIIWLSDNPLQGKLKDPEDNSESSPKEQEAELEVQPGEHSETALGASIPTVQVRQEPKVRAVPELIFWVQFQRVRERPR